MQCGATLSELFEKRQSSDYEDFVYCDENTYNYLRPRAVNFIEKIEMLID